MRVIEVDIFARDQMQLHRRVMMCMHVCVYSPYVVLEVGMDGCTLYTGVGSTLWAWYA